MGRQFRYNGRRSGLLMPTVPDTDLVPFEPPDHPTIRAAFRNVIESYPRALYDGQGLVRYRTRFLDSVLVSEPERGGALRSFLASDMKDRFGASHARLAELIPFAARLALECIRCPLPQRR